MRLQPPDRASGYPEGDVNGPDGYSPFPGNINQLIMAVPQYAAVLDRTGAYVHVTIHARAPGNCAAIRTAVHRLSTSQPPPPHPNPPPPAGGLVPEFVNPKYADAAKNRFKKPTRLECMMQEHPKVLGPEAKVGFSEFPDWTYSPVKNSVEEARGKLALGAPGEQRVAAAPFSVGELYGDPPQQQQ